MGDHRQNVNAGGLEADRRLGIRQNSAAATFRSWRARMTKPEGEIAGDSGSPGLSVVSVMVVEDEPLTRRALVLALTDEGFDVEEAADAASCRTVLKGRRIDVIALD